MILLVEGEPLGGKGLTQLIDWLAVLQDTADNVNCKRATAHKTCSIFGMQEIVNKAYFNA